VITPSVPSAATTQSNGGSLSRVSVRVSPLGSTTPLANCRLNVIAAAGVITGVYTNGSNRTIGQVALASFTNPGGLEKAGENTYVLSNNSGDANIGPSGIAGKGKVIAGTLEMSNVDLAQEFTDMIVTQRGFQANSRTITTSDTMLQELLTLKR